MPIKWKASSIFLCGILCSLFVRCGEPQLEQALRDGSMTKAKAILTLKPGYLQDRDEDGRTRLHRAILKNRLDSIDLLISKGAAVNVADRYGYTPLHYAAQRGYMEAVRILINNGANSGARTAYGSSPLHWAAERGHEAVVEYLIEHGADPLAVDGDGKTPAHVAEDMDHRRIAGMLRPLHRASREGDVEKMKSLLADHPDLRSAGDRWGRTALHLAMRYDRIRAAQYLLEQGADIRAKDAYGFTPEYYAAESRLGRTGVEILDVDAVEVIDHEVYGMLPKYQYLNVAIVLGGRVVFSKAYGEKSLQYECAWGSVSKPVTAMLVMHLLSKGAIESIDEPIWTYSPRYRNCMPDAYRDAPLTIRHLLTHTSGVPHNNEPTWKNGKLNLKFKPGARDQYSTPGYGILGHVIEDVTGMSYSDAVKTYIGVPVGAESFRAGEDFRAPGARVYSNVYDMALFSLGVMNHVYVPETVLYDEMIQYHGGTGGMGWGILHLNAPNLTIFHGGSNGKPQAHLLIRPRSWISISVLASAHDPHSFELGELSFRLLTVLEEMDSITMDEPMSGKAK